MTTRVTGPLYTITDGVPHVGSIFVRPAKPRPHDGGLIVGNPAPADYTNGVVSFDFFPGPGILTLQNPVGPGQSFPILVGDGPTATLEDVVRAADLAGDEDVASLARMVAQVQDAYAAANDVHRSLEFLATRAEDASQTAVDAAEEAVAASTVWEIIDLHHYSGTGFPEGKVTAPVGATYVDTAATNGAVRWIKTSGTGATGWRVEYGDTGWRDISGMFDPPLTSGAIRVRKTAESVQFLFYYAAVPDGAAAPLTRSFGTGTSQNAPIYSSGGANSGTILSHYSGRLTVQKASTTINYGFILPSATAWPSVLPGIPA